MEALTPNFKFKVIALLLNEMYIPVDDGEA